MASTDIAQVLMTWEPEATADARRRVAASVASFAAACQRAGMSGTVVMCDGAFDAAVCGSDMPTASAPRAIRHVAGMCESWGLQFIDASVRIGGAWPNESTKLTHALRAASLYAPIVLRLDSDETLTDDSDLSHLRAIPRYGMHGALVTWDTIGEQAEGSQNVGTKPHLRAFAASQTLTAGPAYHGSYKVYDAERDEWLALRRRGEENAGMPTGDLLDLTDHVVIVNHPAERSAAMHEAKRRLLRHRYEESRSDR